MTKRKIFTGNAPIGGKAIKSRKIARRVTSKYHIIQKELDAVITSSATNDEKLKQKLLLETQLSELGGINAYQQASVISTQHFNTSKWICKVLRNLLQNKIIQLHNSKPKLFEVGAINEVLKKTSWLDVKAIDLHAQSSLIEECDFFTVEPKNEYDVVVCSMVINCVAKSDKRAEMIFR